MDAIADRIIRPEAAPQRTPVPPFDLVIFGASGDLALRKLFPALAQRNQEGVLPEDSRILAIVRKSEDVTGLPNQIAERLAQDNLAADEIEAFLRRLTMVQADALQPESFAALKQALAPLTLTARPGRLRDTLPALSAMPARGNAPFGARRP